MNPPPPHPPRALLTAASSDPALRVPTAAPIEGAYASAPWSPSTRGWLVPSDAQRANSEREDERRQALALATNRAANAVALHVPRSGATFTAVERPPARVLEEEDYLGTMSKIIRRDFFPALDAMERKLELHTPAWDGRMTGAQTAAAASAAAAAARATPNATPLTAAALRQHRRREGQAQFADETPLDQRPDSPGALEPGAPAAAASASSSALQLYSSASGALIPRPSSAAAAAEAAAAAAVKLHPHELRLGSYLELHTSEDNASFAEIERKRRKIAEEKRPWANAEFEQKMNDQRIVLHDDPNRSGNPSGWKVAVKNKLFFYPQHEGKSELMPDEYDGGKLTPAQQVSMALAQKSASIEYENTRFPGALTNPFPGRHASSKDVGAAAATPSADAAAGSSTPAIGGYKLLRTPNIIPGVGSDSPQMTWGAVLSTPTHLREEDSSDSVGILSLALSPADLAAAAAEAASSSSAAGTRFKIAPTPSRDRVAWGMVESARAKELQAKKRKKADATPVPLAHGLASPLLLGQGATGSRGSASAAASPRTPMLSPAAQRLMASTLRAAQGSSSGGRRSGRPAAVALGGVDMQLRASYTPTPTALSHGRAQGTGKRLPNAPLFNATPGPLHVPGTPTPVRK